MILTCPSCRTRYQTESARFTAPGRNVRCAKCGQVWFQPPPEPEPAPEPEPELTAVMPAADAEPAATLPAASLEVNSAQKDEAVAATPARAASKRLSIPWGQVGSWAALILLVTAIGWAAIQYRQIIANLWPQSASLYAALGMPVNVRGIALVNVAYQQDFEDGQPVLAVTGKVVNISDKEMVVPGIRVVLTDEEKHELYHWTFDPGVPSLKAGAESSFVTRLSSPPPEARNLNIRFLDIGESQ